MASTPSLQPVPQRPAMFSEADLKRLLSALWEVSFPPHLREAEAFAMHQRASETIQDKLQFAFGPAHPFNADREFVMNLVESVVEEAKAHPTRSFQELVASVSSELQDYVEMGAGRTRARERTENDAFRFVLSTLSTWLKVFRVDSTNENEPLCDVVSGLFYAGRPAPSWTALPPAPPDLRNYKFGRQIYECPALAAAMDEARDDVRKVCIAIEERLTHPMTAANLENLAGIQIKYTDTLIEHLKFDFDGRDKILWIFDDVQWLVDTEAMLKRAAGVNKSFVDEEGRCL